jgi:hypothetical protein
MTKEGFFAKVNEKYSEPFLRLSEARSEARKFGKDIPIFYGVLKTDDSGKIIDEQLFLIPKVKKEA